MQYLKPERQTLFSDTHSAKVVNAFQFQAQKDELKTNYEKGQNCAFQQHMFKIFLQIFYFFFQIFYMCFLLTFTYMVLSELPEDVYYIEWILASVVLSITSEEIRQVNIQQKCYKTFISKRVKVSKKTSHFSNCVAVAQ